MARHRRCPWRVHRQSQALANGYIERFNGTVEREVFGAEIYHSVLEAQVVLDQWIKVYNTRRRHRGLRGQTPAGYAKMIRNESNTKQDGGGE